MNTYIALCLLAFVAVASANPPHLPIATIESIPNPNYSFNYAVNDPSTGDNKAQWEARDGDVVRGAYTLVEPDGNVRLVEYTADSLHGFNAVVKRTGPNLHPASLPAAPVLAAPVIEHEPVAVAPIAQVAPVIEHAPVDIGAFDHGPAFNHGPTFDHGPAFNHGPIFDAPTYAHGPAWDLPIYSYPSASPWVHLSGSSYGPKGHVRRWAAGPISLDGKTLTIRSKHH